MDKAEAERCQSPLQIQCLACGSEFVICRHCYRGHRYCSSGCRDHGYERARKKARQRYAKTIEAKADHRDRMRVYRKRLVQACSLQISVMDKSSGQSRTPILCARTAATCVVCGRHYAAELGRISIEDLEPQFFDTD